MNLYISNIPFETTESDLEMLFQSCGIIKRHKILKDLDTGKSRGIGFVEMTNDADGQKAIEALNGYSIRGRELHVSEARPQEKKFNKKPNSNQRLNNGYKERYK